LISAERSARNTAVGFFPTGEARGWSACYGLRVESKGTCVPAKNASDFSALASFCGLGAITVEDGALDRLAHAIAASVQLYCLREGGDDLFSRVRRSEVMRGRLPLLRALAIRCYDLARVKEAVCTISNAAAALP
jgi:hypothetical protein